MATKKYRVVMDVEIQDKIGNFETNETDVELVIEQDLLHCPYPQFTKVEFQGVKEID